MTSDYAKEIGEHLDRLAALMPSKGPGSRRLDRLSDEDKRYIGDKYRAAEKPLVGLHFLDYSIRKREEREAREAAREAAAELEGETK